MSCFTCEAEGGVWQGAGTTCDPNPCGECELDEDCKYCNQSYDLVDTSEECAAGFTRSGDSCSRTVKVANCDDCDSTPPPNSADWGSSCVEGYCCDGECQEGPCGEFLLLEDDVYQTLSNRYRRKPAPSSGPGTELKKLLKSVGIEAKPDCSCNERAQLMDQNEVREPGWCEAHIEEISGWLQEEAQKRGLPYIASAGKLLIRIAIKRAKKGNGSV